jgi:hypothetical protein
MGIKPRHSDKDISAFTEREYQEAIDKLIEIFEYVGEGFIKEARKMKKAAGGFGDRTGNLRSSIGYIIVLNGKVIQETVYQSEKGTDRKTGVRVAKQFMDEITESDGLRLYGVAGMSYAEEVESKGYNVISMQADMALMELTELVKEAA